MKQNPVLLFSLPMVFLITACISVPKLKPYVPKENVKIVYVTTDVAPPTKKAAEKNYLKAKKPPAPKPKAGASPIILISNLNLEPDPVPLNQAFDFHVKFKTDIPGSADNKIVTIFYFKILQNNKTLFTSKSYSIKVNNGNINTRTQHMNPVPAKGVYKIKVFVKYKKYLAGKSIELVIN